MKRKRFDEFNPMGVGISSQSPQSQKIAKDQHPYVAVAIQDSEQQIQQMFNNPLTLTFDEQYIMHATTDYRGFRFYQCFEGIRGNNGCPIYDILP